MIICPKCEAEYEPTGYDEEDSGETECECGFKFFVIIEYQPEYNCYCVEHDFGEPRVLSGTKAMFCIHCGKFEILPTI